MANKKKRKAAAVAEADQSPDVATPPAKRGRPSKAAKEAALAEAANVATPPAKRGRPAKAKTTETEPTQETTATSTSAKINTSPTKASAKNKATANTSLRRSNRGPANAGTTASDPRTSSSATNAKTNGTVVAVKETKPKGKANGKAKAATPVKASTAKKGSRGVYKKKSAKAAGKAAATANVDEEEEEDDASDEDLAPEPVEVKPAKRGRKANFSVNVPAGQAASEEAEDADEEDADEPSYWLMKAEPESRIEKGKDVKFSIDDLLNATEPEAWDGVRNPTARNNMRSMLKGEQAFFYHSNCKVPGIAGIMEIVEEHTPDESALDPNHPYYDPKSTADKPRWAKVRVSFRRKFPALVKLKELQKYAKEGGILQNLQTIKQSRLSVSKVSKREWDFILTLAGAEDEEQKVMKDEETIDGNEPKTNGKGAGLLNGFTAVNGAEAGASQLGGQSDASTFGPGEGGVTGADSDLAAVWKKAIGS